MFLVLPSCALHLPPASVSRLLFILIYANCERRFPPGDQSTAPVDHLRHMHSRNWFHSNCCNKLFAILISNVVSHAQRIIIMNGTRREYRVKISTVVHGRMMSHLSYTPQRISPRPSQDYLRIAESLFLFLQHTPHSLQPLCIIVCRAGL